MPDPNAPTDAAAQPGRPPVTPATTFACHICGEPSSQICRYCAKDACENHLCPKCFRCSDCCTCEVPLDSEATDSDR